MIFKRIATAEKKISELFRLVDDLDRSCKIFVPGEKYQHPWWGEITKSEEVYPAELMGLILKHLGMTVETSKPETRLVKMGKKS